MASYIDLLALEDLAQHFLIDVIRVLGNHQVGLPVQVVFRPSVG